MSEDDITAVCIQAIKRSESLGPFQASQLDAAISRNESQGSRFCSQWGFVWKRFECVSHCTALYDINSSPRELELMPSRTIFERGSTLITKCSALLRPGSHLALTFIAWRVLLLANPSVSFLLMAKGLLLLYVLCPGNDFSKGAHFVAT